MAFYIAQARRRVRVFPGDSFRKLVKNASPRYGSRGQGQINEAQRVPRPVAIVTARNVEKSPRTPRGTSVGLPRNERLIGRQLHAISGRASVRRVPRKRRRLARRRLGTRAVMHLAPRPIAIAQFITGEAVSSQGRWMIACDAETSRDDTDVKDCDCATRLQLRAALSVHEG